LGDISTVIYYTSNREEPEFEAKIQKRLLESIGDMPLISVSQKPIDFGYNVCVGDVGVSNQNVFRQLQIGAMYAETPFIISAEADCFYPPEYFKYAPDDEDMCYRYSHVWMLYATRHYPKGVYQRKRYSECAQMVGRKHYIKVLNERLKDRNWWNAEIEHGKSVPTMWPSRAWKWFNGEHAVINIKTKNGMHYRTGLIDAVPPIEDINYWGSAPKLWEEMGQE